MQKWGEIQETHDVKQICQQSRTPFSFVTPHIYRHSLLRSGVSVCAVKMNECQLDSAALRVCNEPRFCFFDLGGGDKWRTHSLAIYEKMHDTHSHKQGHTHTHARLHTHAHMRRCQRGNELLIREYAPERSSALINFVPASDKERRGNVVNLVSLETSSVQLAVGILSLLL